MGALMIEHELTWVMKLSDSGYTAWELVDERGVRWGWLVNAAATGWLCHTGSWGQAEDLGHADPPVSEDYKHVETAAEGRSWVEEAVAESWDKRRTGE